MNELPDRIIDLCEGLVLTVRLREGDCPVHKLVQFRSRVGPDLDAGQVAGADKYVFRYDDPGEDPPVAFDSSA